MQVVVDGILTAYSRVNSAVEHFHGKEGVSGVGLDGHTKTDSSRAMARPVMLVLHGWGDNSRNWLTFSKQFSDSYDVIAVDLPGFGGTEMPSEPWGLDEYARFVGQFLHKIDVRPKIIVGHSNGGAVAIRALARGEVDADALVLLASAGIRNRRRGHKKAWYIMAKAGKVLTRPLPGGVRSRLRRKLYAAAGSDMLVSERLEATFKRIIGDDIQTDASQLTQPTLIVYGQEDEATPPEFGRMLHERISGSTLEIVGGAGHFVYQDQSRIVEKLIREFLR